MGCGHPASPTHVMVDDEKTKTQEEATILSQLLCNDRIRYENVTSGMQHTLGTRCVLLTHSTHGGPFSNALLLTCANISLMLHPKKVCHCLLNAQVCGWWVYYLARTHLSGHNILWPRNNKWWSMVFNYRLTKWWHHVRIQRKQHLPRHHHHYNTSHSMWGLKNCTWPSKRPDLLVFGRWWRPF